MPRPVSQRGVDVPRAQPAGRPPPPRAPPRRPPPPGGGGGPPPPRWPCRMSVRGERHVLRTEPRRPRLRTAPSSGPQHVPLARSDRGHVSEGRREPHLEHDANWGPVHNAQPSRSGRWRRARRRQCSALRFDPAGPAGPAGIDGACARHVMGSCAMAFLDGYAQTAENELTTACIERMFETSRLCRSAHPPRRTQCMRRAFLIVAHRAQSSAPPKLATGCYARAFCVNARAPESRTPGSLRQASSLRPGVKESGDSRGARASMPR